MIRNRRQPTLCQPIDSLGNVAFSYNILILSHVEGAQCTGTQAQSTHSYSDAEHWNFIVCTRLFTSRCLLCLRFRSFSPSEKAKTMDSSVFTTYVQFVCRCNGSAIDRDSAPELVSSWSWVSWEQRRDKSVFNISQRIRNVFLYGLRLEFVCLKSFYFDIGTRETTPQCKSNKNKIDTKKKLLLSFIVFCCVLILFTTKKKATQK